MRFGPSHREAPARLLTGANGGARIEILGWANVLPLVCGPFNTSPLPPNSEYERSSLPSVSSDLQDTRQRAYRVAARVWVSRH
jgi:hypothetical protein